MPKQKKPHPVADSPYAELVGAAFRTFREFHAQLAEDDPGHELADQIGHMMDKEPDACIAIFGAGYIAGVHGAIQALSAMREVADIQDQMSHTPSRRIPRA